jgi:hypothetical protein
MCTGCKKAWNKPKKSKSLSSTVLLLTRQTQSSRQINLMSAAPTDCKPTQLECHACCCDDWSQNSADLVTLSEIGRASWQNMGDLAHCTSTFGKMAHRSEPVLPVYVNGIQLAEKPGLNFSLIQLQRRLEEA